MKSRVHVHLMSTPGQTERLTRLQATFAAACNALSPLAAETRCWNRVALHHLAYKQLREAFPELGSQMVCNAIYSVSRACRAVYQHPTSPFNLARLEGKPLPTLRFAARSPVYFDRHTLSIKNGQASMFTLDGRMRFQIELSPEVTEHFRTTRLREILLGSKGEQFSLSFVFDDEQADDPVGKRGAPTEDFDAVSGHVKVEPPQESSPTSIAHSRAALQT